MYSIKAAPRGSLSRRFPHLVLPLGAGLGHPLRHRGTHRVRAAGPRSVSGRGAGWRSRMEKGSPAGEPSPLPPSCFQPGRRCLAEPGRPLAEGGRDCPAAECNQSREETNNASSPRSGGTAGAALLFSEDLSGLPGSWLGGWAPGEGCTSRKGSPSRGRRPALSGEDAWAWALARRAGERVGAVPGGGHAAARPSPTARDTPSAQGSGSVSAAGSAAPLPKQRFQAQRILGFPWIVACRRGEFFCPPPPFAASKSPRGEGGSRGCASPRRAGSSSASAGAPPPARLLYGFPGLKGLTF